MKVFKKLSMLFVAVAMMMTTVTTTNAESEKQSLTVKKDGSTFNAYQILDAKKESGTFTYKVNNKFQAFFSNNEYGYEFNPDKGIIKGDKVYVTTDGDGLNNGANKTEKFQVNSKMSELTMALQKYITETAVNPIEVLDSGVASELGYGYYLVTEASHNQTNTDKLYVPSKAMLVNLTDTAVNMFPKDDEFTVDKDVKAGENYADENTAGLGDVVEYRVKSVLPVFDSNETNLDFKFIDTLSEGLDFDTDSLVVKAGEDTLTNGKDYNVTFEEKIMTVQFIFNEDMSAYSKLGTSIELTYKARINENAIVNDPSGNKNEVKLVYGNENEFIKDSTTTYVYGFDLHKVGLDGAIADAQPEELADAEFQLLDPITKEPIEVTDANGTKTTTIKVEKDETGKAVVSVNGLKDGTYILRETKAPNGYAILQGDITVTVIANTNENGKLTGTATITASATANGGGDVVRVEDDNITVTVTNYKGISLPETGGMGTTIFMIGGAALIALAGVMLVVYSKKSKKA